MTDKTNLDVESVIADFLYEVPQPTARDWDGLLTRFPQFAADIVDAALMEKNRVSFEAESIENAPVSGDVLARTTSRAINLAYSRSSPQLKATQDKIASFQGPAIRNLCTELAIPHVALLSGVLAGTISPPIKLLRRLGENFGEPIAALRESFSQSFRARPMPAFKSENGKPSVSTRPKSWEEAVRSLDLSDEQTKSLLAWDTDKR
jgi:hypothetical protein